MARDRFVLVLACVFLFFVLSARTLGGVNTKKRAKNFFYTRTCARSPQIGPSDTSFSVVPVLSSVAVLVDSPIMVDKVAWEQGALVSPAGG